MNKYERLKKELDEVGTGKMKCFGNSMTPLLENGGLLTFKKCEDYDVGDIVFCKVKGRYIDAHKITKKNPVKGYLISNNHGHDNGWTKTIYGKMINVEY
jgi:phage repressor protein C with HTH and peptisase S24 domain